jgi:hypothetical protein
MGDDLRCEYIDIETTWHIMLPLHVEHIICYLLTGVSIRLLHSVFRHSLVVTKLLSYLTTAEQAFLTVNVHTSGSSRIFIVVGRSLKTLYRLLPHHLPALVDHTALHR